MRPIDATEESWEVLRRFLPSNLDESGRECGAFRRARGEIKSAEVLLRLILLHVAGGLSLEQAVVRAKEKGLVNVSAVGLFKRLRTSGQWLSWLTAELAKSLAQDCAGSIWEGRVVRVLDATSVTEPGPTGTEWRVHYSLRLPQLTCDFLEVTDIHGGETLKRLPVEKGNIVLCDRGYCRREAVAQVLRQEADVVVRLNCGTFPLLNSDGDGLDLVKLVSRLKVGEIGEWQVRFEHAGRRHPLRLCVLRKSKIATQRAQRKAAEKAQKRGQQVRPETMKLAGYVLVLTSLPGSAVTAEQVLELYRARWQVELAFKRLKQLLGAGHVPKTTDPSSLAWLQAKIVTALLIEHMIREAKFFSPWGYRLSQRAPLAGVQGSS